MSHVISIVIAGITVLLVYLGYPQVACAFAVGFVLGGMAFAFAMMQ